MLRVGHRRNISSEPSSQVRKYSLQSLIGTTSIIVQHFLLGSVGGTGSVYVRGEGFGTSSSSVIGSLTEQAISRQAKSGKSLCDIAKRLIIFSKILFVKKVSCNLSALPDTVPVSMELGDTCHPHVLIIEREA